MEKINANRDSNDKIPFHPRDKANGFFSETEPIKKYNCGSFSFQIQSPHGGISFKDNKPCN